MGAERPDKRAMRCRISAEMQESEVMTRRTASRAKAPRCASENRVQPVVASQGNLFDSSSARLEKRASWRTSRHDSCAHGAQPNTPHGTGKPAANRDPAPLATANGYRPADGWGVVIQAWRPGKTGIHKTKTPTCRSGSCRRSRKSECKTMIPRFLTSASVPTN